MSSAQCTLAKAAFEAEMVSRLTLLRTASGLDMFVASWKINYREQCLSRSIRSLFASRGMRNAVPTLQLARAWLRALCRLRTLGRIYKMMLRHLSEKQIGLIMDKGSGALWL